MKILLDAGHGGKDPGAVSNIINEKDITLEVVLKLRDILMKDNPVLLTRDNDNTLLPGERLKMLNDYQPEIFISVHCNSSSNPDAHGIETLYRDDNDKIFAQAIQNSLVTKEGLKSRGIKQDIGDFHRRLAVLSGPEKVIACLIEIGFISNEDDLEVIKDTDLIAEAIAEGVKEYADNN